MCKLERSRHFVRLAGKPSVQYTRVMWIFLNPNTVLNFVRLWQQESP